MQNTVALETEQYDRLRVGQAVLIRRTSGDAQRAEVETLHPDRGYMAPELLTFRVTWIRGDGKAMARWCSLFDLLPWPADWARMM